MTVQSLNVSFRGHLHYVVVLQDQFGDLDIELQMPWHIN